MAKSYMVDIPAVITVHVEAKSEAAARRKMRELIGDCGDFLRTTMDDYHMVVEPYPEKYPEKDVLRVWRVLDSGLDARFEDEG